jgi:hypothetical protein
MNTQCVICGKDEKYIQNCRWGKLRRRRHRW